MDNLDASRRVCASSRNDVPEVRHPRLSRLFGAVLTAATLLFAATPAHGEIVKAPTGESSTLAVNAPLAKTLSKHKVKFGASGAAKASGTTLTMPYTLSRWDFGTREGDVAYFAKNTGFTLKAGKRKATVVHPRLVLDSPTGGYVTMLIAN